MLSWLKCQNSEKVVETPGLALHDKRRAASEPATFPRPDCRRARGAL